MMWFRKGLDWPSSDDLVFKWPVSFVLCQFVSILRHAMSDRCIVLSSMSFTFVDKKPSPLPVDMNSKVPTMTRSQGKPLFQFLSLVKLILRSVHRSSPKNVWHNFEISPSDRISMIYCLMQLVSRWRWSKCHSLSFFLSPEYFRTWRYQERYSLAIVRWSEEDFRRHGTQKLSVRTVQQWSVFAERNVLDHKSIFSSAVIRVLRNRSYNSTSIDWSHVLNTPTAKAPVPWVWRPTSAKIQKPVNWSCKRKRNTANYSEWSWSF